MGLTGSTIFALLFIIEDFTIIRSFIALVTDLTDLTQGSLGMKGRTVTWESTRLSTTLKI